MSHLLHSALLNTTEIFEELRTQLEAATTRAVAELVRSDMPDVYKVAKRRKLRLKMEPFPPQRKRLTLSAVYDDGDKAVADPNDVSSLIVAGGGCHAALSGHGPWRSRCNELELAEKPRR